MSQQGPYTTTILRRRQVEQRTGLARSTLYQYIQNGTFPKPVRRGSRAVRWEASDVDEWIASRVKVSPIARETRAR